MKASNPHLLSVDCQDHVKHVGRYDAARRQNTEKQRRANSTRGPQLGSARAAANVAVDGVRRQDCGGVQPTGVATASGSRRTGAIGRNGSHRSGRCGRRCLTKSRGRCWSNGTCVVARAYFCARRCAIVGANGRRLDTSGDAHGRRGSAANLLYPEFVRAVAELGLRSVLLLLKVERAMSAKDLLALRERVESTIAKSKGEPASLEFSQRVNFLLSQ